MTTKLAPVFLLPLLAACPGDIGSPSTPVGPVSEPASIDVRPVGDGALLPPAEASLRQRRRMDLDQLEASLRAVTGGIGWTERRGGAERSVLEQLAPTLGVPDFLEVTHEDLTPSAMFHKFLDDAARAVCGRLLEAELTRPANERTFFVEVEPGTRPSAQAGPVRANLAALLLRFHGRRLAPESGEVGAWLELMTEVEQATNDLEAPWATVCVGLITHPDFYLY